MRRVDVIIQKVSKYYEINPMHILGRKHTIRYARPRQIAMYLTHHHSDLSSTCIGAEFGKDHTTVLAAIKRIDALKESLPELNDTLKTIESWLPWTPNQ